MCKKLYLGVYESELEAAKAHDRAARFHFPDKSMTNFATEAEADMLISDQEVRAVVARVITIQLLVQLHLVDEKEPLFPLTNKAVLDLESYSKFCLLFLGLNELLKGNSCL